MSLTSLHYRQGSECIDRTIEPYIPLFDPLINNALLESQAISETDAAATLAE